MEKSRLSKVCPRNKNCLHPQRKSCRNMTDFHQPRTSPRHSACPATPCHRTRCHPAGPPWPPRGSPCSSTRPQRCGAPRDNAFWDCGARATPGARHCPGYGPGPNPGGHCHDYRLQDYCRAYRHRYSGTSQRISHILKHPGLPGMRLRRP